VLCTTPFGFPVEPEVYSRNSGCSASTHSTSAAAGSGATASCHQTSRPGVMPQPSRGAAAAFSSTRQVGTA